jgi:hypothetical protein
MEPWTKVTRLLLLLICFAAPAYAQFSSGIEGTVVDNTGAAIAGAQVTVTDTQLGVSKTDTTNQSGYFRITSIAASAYKVQIQMNGFKTWDQKDLTLQVGEIRTISPTLEVGSVAAEVDVSATQAAVNLTRPTTGSVISETSVTQTPLVGQNIYGLVALTPGMTGSAINSADNFSNEFAINVNAAGLRQEQNGYLIDGANTTTPSRGGETSVAPNPEIVQSIDVRTNDFDAQKGINGGATVEVFTKSGTNNYHGTIDYYFLNDSLSARTEFEGTVPTFQRNEMGATFGGPVIKNKLFLFGAADFLRSSTTSAGQYTVETPDLVKWVAANLPNNVATYALQKAPPLIFPTTGIQTVAQVEASTPGYYAPPANIPAGLDVLGTANISYAVPRNGYQWSVRGDYYLRQNDRAYVTAIRTNLTTQNTTPRPALNNANDTAADYVNLDYTHIFSPRLLNEARAYLVRPQGSVSAVPAMDIPYINVTGFQGFSNWAPGNYIQSTYGWSDVLTATIRTHTLKVGFDQFNIRENDQQSGAFGRPTYNFNSLLDFIQDSATTESATPVALTTHLQAPYDRRYRELYTGVYAQDDWKLRPTVTLNAGVRYDQMSNLFSILTPQLTNFTFGQGATYDQQIANGVSGLQRNSHVLDHNVWGLTPRAGFSWDVFGKARTAIRGGVGAFSDQPPYLHITDITAGNLPNIYTPSISVYQGTTPKFQLCSPPTAFAVACPIVDTSNVVLNASGGIVGQLASLGGYSPHYKLTQVEEWTLSMQQQLRSDLIFELNYSGSAAHHLPIYNQDVNRFAGDLIQNDGALKRLNSNFAAITYATSDGNSVGNYGSATLTRLSSHGLALRGIYTWGKTLDTISNAGSLNAGSITTTTQVIQNGNIAAQRGRSDFDIRQQFSADGTWTVPSDYSNVFERNLLGGWQFGGIWIVQSGLPFTVYNGAPFKPVLDANGAVIGNTGGDYNADGSNYDVPNVPSFGSHLTGQKKKQYLNGLFPASAFPAPSLGEEGSLGRNTYDQLGYNNVNFTAQKFFTVPWVFGEKMRIEARGEVFNLFNRVNLTTVTSDLSSPLFGHSTSQLPARSLQIHLRASF